MADNDTPDEETQDDAANPEPDAGPPPLAEGGADAEPEAGADDKSAADSMEEILPKALKGGEGTVGLGLGSMSEKDERTFAMLAHILGIFTVVGPLVIWMLKKDESPFVDDQGKEAIGFQLVVLIAIAIVAALSSIPVVNCFTPFLGLAVGVVNIIMVILAGLKANEGVAYRYPLALRVL